MIEARIRGTEDGSTSEKIISLNESQDSYLKKMKLLHQQISDASKEVLAIEKSIAEQREKMGGNNATQTNMAIQKQIRVMENRLDKALVKFNKSLATNKQLRQVIDNLRRERAVFENVYRKLEKELSEQKKCMADIIEASNNAYESRDEAQVKMMALKEKAEKEFQAFTQEIKELDRILEQDRKFKSFMTVKNAQRTALNASNAQKNKNDSEKDPYKSSQENMADHVEDYDRAFSMIKEVTGITDINELVQKFTDVEDQNFSLFNYVNEVNNQVEKLNEEIASIRSEIEKYQSATVHEENDRQSVAKDIEGKLSDARKEISECEQNYSKINQTFESLQSGMGKMIDRLEQMTVTTTTTTSGAATVLKKPQFTADGENDKSFLIKDLGWIESRANDLVMANFLHALPRRSAEEKESATIVSLTFGGITMQGAMQPLMSYSIQAPSTG